MGSRVKGLNADFSADGLCSCVSVQLRACSCVSMQLCVCAVACLCNCLTVLSDGSGSQTGLFPADRLRTFCLAG